jgi:hypothetical protein
MLDDYVLIWGSVQTEIHTGFDAPCPTPYRSKHMQVTHHHYQASPVIDLVGVTTLVFVFGGRINSSPAKKKGFGTKKKKGCTPHLYLDHWILT